MNRLLSDLRYGARMLAKTPSATAMVLLALSLGIGLSALTFSLIEGAVLPVLPVDGGDRIVRVERGERTPVTADDYAAWSGRQRSFEGLGAVEMSTVTLAAEGASAEPVSSASMTPSLFELLRVEPTLGRPFTAEDAAPGAPAVVLVSHEVWRDRLRADPAVLGRIVRLNGRPAEVVGVMPEGFGFPWDQQVWAPLAMDPLRDGLVDFTWSPERGMVVGRMREGVTLDEASRELTAITQTLDRETLGEAGPGARVRVSGYTDLFSEPGASAALAALMLGVAFLVLLVACANVANVLLARAIDRTREVAVRLAMGASRGRIFAQLLTELLVLAAAGAAGGIGTAVFAARYVDAAMPPGMPYWIALRMDARVVAFVAVVAVLSALFAGLLPALQASRSNTNELLKDTARGSSSFRMGRVMRRLIGVEMALSFVLLVLAGLFVRSAANFRGTDFAFAPEEVYTASLRLPDATYPGPADRLRFTDELRRAVGGLPGVDGVALATAVPGVGGSPVVPVQLDENAGPGEEGARTRSIVVTPGFFDLFRTPVRVGRDFDSRDQPAAPAVAIVNETFASRHFPGGAIDRRIRQVGPGGAGEWLTIVGVVPDLMAGGVEGEVPEAVYLPLAQSPRSELRILARPRGAFASVAAPIRQAVAGLDPDVALFDVRPLDGVIAAANSQYTWFSLLFLVSGGVALFLASLGLYGVMAFWVIQRTREIGVRMALGGQRAAIVRLVLAQGLRQTSVGLGAGVLLAIPAATLVRSGLYGVAFYDPLVFGSIVAVLIAAAWLGCWFPARRATRLDPLRAIAAE